MCPTFAPTLKGKAISRMKFIAPTLVGKNSLTTPTPGKHCSTVVFTMVINDSI